MIKSVLQAIPVNTISCFLLPQTLVQYLHFLIANFGGIFPRIDPYIRLVGAHYISKPKCKDGMNFRDLEAFNSALLAKHDRKLTLY